MGYFLTQLAKLGEAAISSVGTHIAFSISGIFFFGLPVAFSVGAYVFAIAAKAGWAWGWALISALAAAALIGYLFTILYRRLSNDSFAVFSLASLLAFDALLKSWDKVTGGVLGIAGVPRPGFIHNLTDLVFFQILLVIAVFLFEYCLLRSPWGRAFQAHKENKIFLDAFGYSAKNIGSLAVILSSILAALAGIVAIWRIQFLDPSFGGIALLLIMLTIGILALKPQVKWLAGSVLAIILLPEILRFFPFPASVLGHLRVLFYSVLLIILVKKLSKRYTAEKRFV